MNGTAVEIKDLTKSFSVDRMYCGSENTIMHLQQYIQGRTDIGRISMMPAFGAGFCTGLSGRDNIILNGDTENGKMIYDGDVVTGG